VVNSDNVILDDIWHGAPITAMAWGGPTIRRYWLDRERNNVTAYGLFVEHYQKYEVI